MADTKDYEQIAKRLQVQAQKGDAKSQYHLGILYNDGKGVTKDYGQAASWYLKAASQGHQKAQLYLGLLFLNGRGVPKDYRQSAQWLAKSAEQGEQKAQYFLGVLYYRGLGVEQDTEMAEHWLELSAQQGNNDAQKLLDEILSLDMLNLLDGDFDNSIEDENISHDQTNKTSSHSSLGLISAAVLGIALLAAAGGAGYYFFIRGAKPDKNLSDSLPHVTDNSYVRENNNITNDIPMNIDVYKLAEKELFSSSGTL